MLDTSKKINVYESDTISLPPIQLVLGEVPSPDPVQIRRPQVPRTPRADLRIAVRRIIAHLENSR